jgi:RNA recognition motif-containing protein
LYEFFEKIGPLKYARIVKSKEGKSMGTGLWSLKNRRTRKRLEEPPGKDP